QANENIESNLGQINQILLETGGIENLRQLLDQSRSVQTSLDISKQGAIAVHNQISQIILETGGLENLRQLLDQYTTVQTLLDRNRQEAIAVRSLDAYLMEFRKPRNHRELRKFLWNELGFVGLIIYFLRLITSRK
ncbi:MAG: hypothetical protein KGR70_08895, partial [Cyanobacteria bacterium REEB494]|nr:hypothetical protein [Cyanobacteria bacterium REEB494]